VSDGIDYSCVRPYHIDLRRSGTARLATRCCQFGCTRLETRYESQNTKLPELIFSAVVGDDGARDVRFERVLCT
jgi:hypothetical protein